MKSDSWLVSKKTHLTKNFRSLRAFEVRMQALTWNPSWAVRLSTPISGNCSLQSPAASFLADMGTSLPFLPFLVSLRAPSSLSSSRSYWSLRLSLSSSLSSIFHLSKGVSGLLRFPDGNPARFNRGKPEARVFLRALGGLSSWRSESGSGNVGLLGFFIDLLMALPEIYPFPEERERVWECLCERVCVWEMGKKQSWAREREEWVSFRVGYKFQGFCLLEKMTHTEQWDTQRYTNTVCRTVYKRRDSMYVFLCLYGQHRIFTLFISWQLPCRMCVWKKISGNFLGQYEHG